MTAVLSPSPRRYLALWLAFLPTDRLERRQRVTDAPGEPLVLVEKVKGALRLAAVNRRALKLGLAPGVALADARARVPALRVAALDPVADAAFLDRLAEDCDRFSPRVALDPPDGLILDITGCAHLSGGEAAVRGALLARMKRARLNARAAIASTPHTARALARFSTVAVAAPGEETAVIRPLPVAALDPPGETRVALTRAGLKTLGALADRPRAPLAARFGAELVGDLERTLAREDARITPRRPEPLCFAERRFAEPVTRLEDVKATLAELAGDTARELETRAQGGRLYEADFFRADGVVRRLAVETGRPTRDPRIVLRLFRERLESLADPLDPGYGFDLIRLAVPRAGGVRAVQCEIEGGARVDDELADLVARLTARFGRDRVLRFSPRDSHDPDRASTLRPALDWSGAETAWPTPEPGEPPARPLTVFDPPQPIETLAEVPDGPPARFRWRRVMHEIARAEGPERIAPEWWRVPGAPTRDYYRVEDVDGRRFWVFRAGLRERGDASPRWYLHGLFA